VLGVLLESNSVLFEYEIIECSLWKILKLGRWENKTGQRDKNYLYMSGGTSGMRLKLDSLLFNEIYLA
jgi:hypothetical protein